MVQLQSLKSLIHELSRLPGVGEKSAQRMAYFLLKKGPAFIECLLTALKEVSEKVHLCTECFAYTENTGICDICMDPKRSDTTLCVVESPPDIFKIDSSGSFSGKYHVLHGALAPLEGVHPDHLKISELLNRVDSNKNITEVILALDADLEGDTTALYLSKMLQNKGIRVTRLAYGVPFGSDIDYIDRRTLGKALENRVEV